MIRGSATTDHQFAYFTPRGSNLVYSYEWNTEQWNQLRSCPYCNCALVIIDGTLTTVGGYRSGQTNKLFTLRQRQWVEEYPPMNTACFSPAVVSTFGGYYIIVIGGYCGGGGWTGTVELFQVNTRRWYKLTNIPQPLDFPSATICDNQLHVIGWDDKGYTCSIPSSDEPITSQSIPHLISWTSLPRLPVTESTAATLYEQLVIIGGMQGVSTVNSIHQLVDGKWVEICSMSSGRSECLVVSPSPDRMMIVGGIRTGGLASAVLSLFMSHGPFLDIVEECIVV